MKKFLLVGLWLMACLAWGLAEEPKIQDCAPFTYAGLECSGPYTQIGAKMGEFMQAFFGQGLTPAGAPFGLYLNSPEQVKPEELKWIIGFPVAKEANVASPLKKGEFNFARAAVIVHAGPYEKVGESHAKLMQFVTASGYKVAGPCLEKYLNNPMQVKPEDLRTEIIYPVEKK